MSHVINCTSLLEHRGSLSNPVSIDMPPKTNDVDETSPTAVLPLQDWLKLLSGRGVDMRVAMVLASKLWVVIMAGV